MAQVHERSLQGDFLMALLKDVVQERRARGVPPLKVRSPRPTPAPANPLEARSRAEATLRRQYEIGIFYIAQQTGLGALLRTD